MTLIIGKSPPMLWPPSTKPPGSIPPGPGVKTRSLKSTRTLIRGALERFEDFLGWPVDLLLRHFEKRLFELAMTVAMLGEGLLLILSPQSMTASSMQLMIHMLPLWMCIMIFVGLGGARILALVLNGHWMPGGAYVRAIGAVAGAFMWGQMGASLLGFNIEKDAPLSPGIPIYMTLTLFEVVSFYFALVGAKVYGRSR